MNAVVSIFRELVGLFIDDGSLALAIVAVIALAGILSALMPNMPWVAGAILLFGCLGLLLANVARAAQS
jgi:Na+/H+ antiporter NhaD/arsenite permease-like protein